MIQQQLPQEQQQQLQEENANCMRSASNLHKHQTFLGQRFPNLIQFYCSTTEQVPPHFVLGQNLIQRSANPMSRSSEVPVSQQLQQFQQQKLQRQQQIQQQQLQNVGCSSISMQFSSSMINQGYLTQETSPSQQTSDRRIMWQGILEWSDNGKISNPNGTMKHIPCYITLNRKEGDSDLKMETWPQKLVMQLLPKQLICNIGVQYFENSNYITLHAKTGGTVDDFTKVISSTVIGCVQIRNVINEMKVLILLFNINRKACIGFIPNDQINFVRQLRKQIYIKKIQTIQQLQRQIQESQQRQKTQLMLSPHMSTLFPSTITFQVSRNHAIELLPVLWKGVLEWANQTESNTLNNVTRHIFCGIALRTNGRDITKLKVASWPRKMKMYLLPKRPFIDVASRFHANSIFALLHLIPGESLDNLTEMLKSDFVGCIDVNNSNSPFTETKTLVILPTSNKGLCVGFFSNDHSDLIGELRKQSLFRKVAAVNQKFIQNQNTIASHGGTLPFSFSNETEHRTEVILPTQLLGSTMEGYLGHQGGIASNGSVIRPFENQSANVNQNFRQEASTVRSSYAVSDSQATITPSTSAISDTSSSLQFNVNVHFRNHTSDADLNSENNNSSNRAKRMRLSNIPEVKNAVNKHDENDNYENSSSCSVCMENAVDTVIYACGHMCLCFSCAQKLLKRTDDSRRCPICRSAMRDVIKVYRS